MGAVVFYISTTNEDGETSDFMVVEMDEWDEIWKKKNSNFKEYLASQPTLLFLKNLKFFVCNGNHCLWAWMNVISKMYATKLDWHCMVDSIFLATKGKIGIVM